MDFCQIDEAELKKMNIKVVLMTANEIEKEELIKRMVPHNNGMLRQYFDENNNFILGYFGRYHIAHIHCKEQGSLRPGASMLTMESALEIINPDLIIMVGIAYGTNKTNQNIGDVLISKSIYSTDMLKRSPENQVEDRNILISPEIKILNLIENNHLDEIQFRIHYGILISGETLINDNDYKENMIEIFKENKENIIGGEMEGIGLASLLKRKNNHNWVVIKGISDWADGKKDVNKEKNQRLAVKNALYVCWRILVRTDLAKLFPSSTSVLENQFKKARVFVNGYALFYFRNNAQIGRRGLEKRVRNRNISIKKIECDIKNINPVFHTAGYQYVIELQKYLGCKNYELMNIETPDNMVDFYKRKIGKNSLFPTGFFKAIVFDFGGTLSYKEESYSTWELMWLELGYDIDECVALHRKYRNKDINHKEWCDQTAEYFKKKNFNKDILDKIASKINLIDGVRDTFKILKKEDIKIYICSGSVRYIIENILGEELRDYVEEISANDFVFDNKEALVSIRSAEYDFEMKANFVEKIAQKNNCVPSDILFVGNSFNDQYVYRSKAKTLLVNPQDVDYSKRDKFNFIIREMKNLKEILKYAIPEKY
jgi:HAD superfamily phosphoserine phosphatase-like hydrolase